MKYIVTIISLVATLVLAKTAEIPVTVPVNYSLVTVDKISETPAKEDLPHTWRMDIEFTGQRGYLMTNVAPNARSERFILSFNGTIFTDAQMQVILGSDYAGFVAATGYGLTVAVDPVKEKIIDTVIGSIAQ